MNFSRQKVTHIFLTWVVLVVTRKFMRPGLLLGIGLLESVRSLQNLCVSLIEKIGSLINKLCPKTYGKLPHESDDLLDLIAYAPKGVDEYSKAEFIGKLILV
jgi:hypothetical protein